jgi:hypothetical protein
MTGLPWRSDPDGLRLAVRVTPRASRNALAGIVEGPEGRPLLAVRLAAPPVEGAANSALVKFLASELSLPRSSFSLASGETARIKIVRLVGEPNELAARLSALLKR